MAQTIDTSEPSTLPPPLMTSTPGSFARKTIVERKPQILREVSQAYAYPAEIQAALTAFSDEIRSALIQPLTETAPDIARWNAEWLTQAPGVVARCIASGRGRGKGRSVAQRIRRRRGPAGPGAPRRGSRSRVRGTPRRPILCGPRS